MRNSKINPWLCLVMMVGIYPVVGVLWSLVYGNWGAFKISLFMVLPILILIVIFVSQVIAHRLIKKQKNQSQVKTGKD